MLLHIVQIEKDHELEAGDMPEASSSPSRLHRHTRRCCVTTVRGRIFCPTKPDDVLLSRETDPSRSNSSEVLFRNTLLDWRDFRFTAIIPAKLS